MSYGGSLGQPSNQRNDELAYQRFLDGLDPRLVEAWQAQHRGEVFHVSYDPDETSYIGANLVSDDFRRPGQRMYATEESDEIEGLQWSSGRSGQWGWVKDANGHLQQYRPRRRTEEGGVLYDGNTSNILRNWQFVGGRHDRERYGFDETWANLTYPCDICGAQRRSKQSLNDHRRGAHGVGNAPVGHRNTTQWH